MVPLTWTMPTCSLWRDGWLRILSPALFWRTNLRSREGCWDDLRVVLWTGGVTPWGGSRTSILYVCHQHIQDFSMLQFYNVIQKSSNIYIFILSSHWRYYVLVSICLSFWELGASKSFKPIFIKFDEQVRSMYKKIVTTYSICFTSLVILYQPYPFTNSYTHTPPPTGIHQW